MHTVSDPFYQDGPGPFVRGVLASMGIEFVVDGALHDEMAVDEGDQPTIYLPPGLWWPSAHSLINRGFLFLAGGTRWAPEFAWHRGQLTAPFPANVIPIHRSAW